MTVWVRKIIDTEPINDTTKTLLVYAKTEISGVGALWVGDWMETDNMVCLKELAIDSYFQITKTKTYFTFKIISQFIHDGYWKLLKYNFKCWFYFFKG